MKFIVVCERRRGFSLPLLLIEVIIIPLPQINIKELNCEARETQFNPLQYYIPVVFFYLLFYFYFLSNLLPWTVACKTLHSKCDRFQLCVENVCDACNENSNQRIPETVMQI